MNILSAPTSFASSLRTLMTEIWDLLIWSHKSLRLYVVSFVFNLFSFFFKFLLLFNYSCIPFLPIPREHYAKWNKPGGEGQIPYDLTFNWNIINRRKKQTKYNQRHWSKEQSNNSPGEVGRGQWGEGITGTTIKDTWTKSLFFLLFRLYHFYCSFYKFTSSLISILPLSLSNELLNYYIFQL